MQVFTDIYEQNGWLGDESVSGQGSTLRQTLNVRTELPFLIDRLGIKTMYDLPCGDFYWFQHVKLPPDFRYVGVDIVPKLIYDLNQKYGNPPYRSFLEWDISRDPLPVPADMIFCRDMLGHFSNADVQKTIRNMKLSRCKYLLATTFPQRETTGDIITGQWRPINLSHYFGLPAPIEIINEGCTEGDGAFSDKSLGLWDLRDLI